ncbi:MAG: aminotransferase class III-fold pyridoxal phosphate-dependent enzyme [Ignavibacteria bacterium]|jgi:glutamate-1-semialdehyde aminotransferase|nr:aminotransferase class III-fold pyridoxal phosphate-dependent enzyme [Ignavibacteria bacterium]
MSRRTIRNSFPNIRKSTQLIKRAEGLIPAFTQTLAKGPTQWIDGVSPKYLIKGKGARVWDADGNEYIDYNMAVGPVILGYSYKKVDNAIRKQLKDGITFSLMHPLEVEVAELIRKTVKNAENVRFSKTGCDVTSAAIRVARAYTGREKVLCCGYHGWHDWYIAVTDRNRGIPSFEKNLTYTFEYNNIDSLVKAIDKDVACVILEPVIFDKPENDFLYKVRDVCTKNNIILIFDEMWTGFRMAAGGAQEYFNIVPDLATYSKAIANGMPLSVLTGKEYIMNVLEKDVFFFTTFGGEALSLAAAKATIEEITDKGVSGHLFSQGEKLVKGINKIAAKHGMDYVECKGYPFRSIVTFDSAAVNPLEAKTYIQQEMIKRGILWGGFHNMSYSHTSEEIEYTLRCYKEILPKLKKAVNKKDILRHIKGDIIQPVFRKTTNYSKQ